MNYWRCELTNRSQSPRGKRTCFFYRREHSMAKPDLFRPRQSGHAESPLCPSSGLCCAFRRYVVRVRICFIGFIIFSHQSLGKTFKVTIIYKKVSATFLPYYTRGPPALEQLRPTKKLEPRSLPYRPRRGGLTGPQKFRRPS